jgi:hypothetical protein
MVHAASDPQSARVQEGLLLNVAKRMGGGERGRVHSRHLDEEGG